MKTLNAIVKVLAALAAVAGAVYLVAAYGDKIVAWAKRVIGCCPWDEGMEEPAEAPAAAEERLRSLLLSSPLPRSTPRSPQPLRLLRPPRSPTSPLPTRVTSKADIA